MPSSHLDGLPLEPFAWLDTNAVMRWKAQKAGFELRGQSGKTMTVPANMTAVLLTGNGGLDRLKLRHDVHIPKPVLA